MSRAREEAVSEVLGVILGLTITGLVVTLALTNLDFAQDDVQASKDAEAALAFTATVQDALDALGEDIERLEAAGLRPTSVNRTIDVPTPLRGTWSIAFDDQDLTMTDGTIQVRVALPTPCAYEYGNETVRMGAELTLHYVPDDLITCYRQGIVTLHA